VFLFLATRTLLKCMDTFETMTRSCSILPGGEVYTGRMMNFSDFNFNIQVCVPSTLSVFNSVGIQLYVYLQLCRPSTQSVFNFLASTLSDSTPSSTTLLPTHIKDLFSRATVLIDCKHHRFFPLSRNQ
jgi:hypothetical protein